MKYFVLDKGGKIICYRGGYNTRRGAINGARSISSPVFNDAIKFTRSMGLPPGGKFANHVEAYIEENSEIVEVSEVTYKTTSGQIITEKFDDKENKL